MMTTQVEERKPERRGIMQSLTGLSVRYVERFMPDPYLFAVILTIVVAALVAFLVKDASATGMLKAWYGGVWGGSQNIFTFAFQMVLILVTGYTLAEAPILKRGIVYIASKPNNQVQAALLCFGVSAALHLLNWGARAGCRRTGRPPDRKKTLARHSLRLPHRRVIHGFHRLDTGGAFVVDSLGQHRQQQSHQRDPQDRRHHGAAEPDHLPALQLLSVIVVLAVLAVAVWRMAPAETLAPDPAIFEDEDQQETETEGKKTFAEWLENLWILNVLVFVAGIAYFWISGFASTSRR